MLLAAGAKVDARNLAGQTPLHVAIRENGTPEVVEVLVAAGANVNAKCNSWTTPMEYAASFHQDASVIRTLIAAGARLKRRSWFTATPASTALHQAAESNANPKVVEALLDAGLGVDSKIKGGYRPLHFAAAWNRNPDVVEVLLSAGANPNARNKLGFAPLHYSVIACILTGVEGPGNCIRPQTQERRDSLLRFDFPEGRWYDLRAGCSLKGANQ